MRIDRSRQRLIEAMVYFSGRLDGCPKLKMYKLLWFFDWLHFRQTGTTVTGLQYSAHPKGPLPVHLDAEYSDALPDLADALEFTREKYGTSYDWEMVRPKPGREFDDQFFSPRQLELIEYVFTEFGQRTGSELAGLTHDKALPWYQVYEVDNRKGGVINLDDMWSRVDLPDGLRNLIAEQSLPYTQSTDAR